MWYIIIVGVFILIAGVKISDETLLSQDSYHVEQLTEIKPKLIGYYSKKSFDRNNGFYSANPSDMQKGALYSSASGYVIVTEVVEEGDDPISKWDDLVLVGEVTSFIGLRGKPRRSGRGWIARTR